MVNYNISTYLSIITLFFTIFIGIFVYSHNRKNKATISFLYLCITIVFWVLFNILADTQTNETFVLLLARESIVFVSLLPLLFVEIIKYLFFLDRKDFIILYTKIKKNLILSTIIITTLSPFKINIEDITFHSWGTAFKPGILYYFLFLHLIIGFGCVLNYLYRERKSLEEPFKSQAAILLIGTSLTVFFSLVMDIILPLLGNTKISTFAPACILLFLLSIALAITHHRLFSLKTVAIEIITISIWMFFLSRLIVSSSSSDIFFNGINLATSLILGILLLRSTFHEIHQREYIENLTQQIKKISLTNTTTQK